MENGKYRQLKEHLKHHFAFGLSQYIIAYKVYLTSLISQPSYGFDQHTPQLYIGRSNQLMN